MWQRGYTLKYFYQLMTERLHCQNLIPFNQNISVLFILVHLFISSMIKQTISIGNDMRQRGNPFHTVAAAGWPPGQPGPVWWLVTLTSPKVNAIVVSRSPSPQYPCLPSPRSSQAVYNLYYLVLRGAGLLEGGGEMAFICIVQNIGSRLQRIKRGNQ